MATNSVVSEIVSEFGDAERPNTHPVPREKVVRWTQSDDIDVLGAAYAFVTDGRHYGRINPPLLFGDYYPFLLKYFARCLREDPAGDWADSRYLAGHGLVGWFRQFWDDPKVPRTSLENIKQWLAGLYREGDQALRTCIVTAILEHLFERRDIAKYFRDWKNDSVLKVAYDEAQEWSDRPGG
jgi:hypothetical protein